MSVDWRTDWPDSRIDELADRVKEAASKAEMADLRRELRERSEGVKRDVGKVADQLEHVVGDPVQEAKQKRAAIVVAVIAALSGVAGTSVLYQVLPH